MVLSKSKKRKLLRTFYKLKYEPASLTQEEALIRVCKILNITIHNPDTGMIDEVK